MSLISRTRKPESEGCLGSTLELAPALLQTTAGHIASAVCDGTGTGIGGSAGSGVLATQTGAAGVVAVHGVSGTAAADVVDGGGTAHVSLELFVEAEDGALTAAVDIAGTSAARSESCWGTRVEACQRGRAGCCVSLGGLGVLQADDVPASSTASVDCRSTRMRHRGMGFDNAVI